MPPVDGKRNLFALHPAKRCPAIVSQAGAAAYGFPNEMILKAIVFVAQRVSDAANPLPRLIGHELFCFGIQFLGRFRNTLQASQYCVAGHIVIQKGLLAPAGNVSRNSFRVFYNVSEPLRDVPRRQARDPCRFGLESGACGRVRVRHRRAGQERPQASREVPQAGPRSEIPKASAYGRV